MTETTDPRDPPVIGGASAQGIVLLIVPPALEVSRQQATAAEVDDAAVDAFASAMKAKMAASRAKGREGWQTCPDDYLLDMLRDHVGRGDMRDVGCIAMMLHINRERSA